MAFLYIILGLALWLTVGWLVSLGLALVDEDVRYGMTGDNVTTFMFVMFWPLVLGIFAFTRLAQFMDPAGRAYDIIDRMEKRREAKRSVIVKSRRFRGREDR